MLINQYRSKTSKFHKQYRKQELEIREKAEDILLNTPQSEEEPDGLYLKAINVISGNIYRRAVNNETAALLKTVWELYVEQKSLRKTLALLPDIYSSFLSLKDVHEIVRNFQRIIKNQLATLN